MHASQGALSASLTLLRVESRSLSLAFRESSGSSTLDSPIFQVSPFSSGFKISVALQSSGVLGEVT